MPNFRLNMYTYFFVKCITVLIVDLELQTNTSPEELNVLKELLEARRV